MNERFVAVSTVTGSRICGCFSKPRCDFSVTKGGRALLPLFAVRTHLGLRVLCQLLLLTCS